MNNFIDLIFFAISGMEDDPFEVQAYSGDSYNFEPANEQVSAGSSMSATKRSQKKGVGGKGTGARGATTMATMIKDSLTQKIPIQICNHCYSIVK